MYCQFETYSSFPVSDCFPSSVENFFVSWIISGFIICILLGVLQLQFFTLTLFCIDCLGLPADRSNCLLGIIVVHKQKPVAVTKTVAPPVKTWMYAERTDNAESTDQNRKMKAAATPVDLGSIESPATEVLIFETLS